MKRKAILLAGASVALIATPVLAQTKASADSTGGLEEIIVTAQKREQSLQAVPVSVTALSAEMLDNQRIATFNDLTRAAPSLTITENTQATNGSIVLRGIGTYAFSTGVEPSVAVIVDDVSVVQQAQAFNNLSDIERVEVLRGPQGTLFGKNASAGLVNIVTKGPSDHLTMGMQLTATDDEQARAEASVSGPFGENSGFRLNGYYDYRKGHIHNLTTGKDINGGTGYGIRGKLKLGLTDNFDVVLIGDYSHQEQNGAANTLLALPAGAKLFGALNYGTAENSGITPGPGNFNARQDEDGPNQSKQWSVSAKATLDVGPAKLISVASYQDWKFDFTTDVDGTDLNILAALTRGAVNGGLVQGGPYHSRQFAQELRLVSDASGPLTYVVGGYFSDSKTDRGFHRGPAALVADWQNTSTNRSLAGFAQLDYKITDTTRVSGGVRVNNEKIGVGFTNLVVPAVLPATNIGCNLSRCRGNSSETETTWKVALQQDIARHVMVFASAATGYKGQAYDIATGFSPAKAAAPIKSETSYAYEIGLKSRFLDNRVQMNITGFLTDYNNFQAQSSVLNNTTTPATLQLGLNNVGKLRTKGVELELQAVPVEALRFDASFAYVDAKIKSFPTATCYSGQTGAQGCFDLDGAGPLTAVGQNLAGATLANAPKFKANIGATLDFPLSSGGLGGFIGLNYAYQSKVNFDLFRNPLTVQRGYGILNGSIGVKTGENEGLKVTLFVNNMFNKHYAAAITDGYSLFGNQHVLIQLLPRNATRYFGIKIRGDF